MVAIKGISGVPEPAPKRPASARDKKSEAKGVAARDGVEISPEAQEASGTARIVQAAKTQDAVRTERVAAAKESIERGDYKRPDIVAVVAERLSKYLP